MANDYKSLISAVRTVALEGAYPELKALHNEVVEALETLVKQRNHESEMYKTALNHVRGLQDKLDDVRAEKENP